MSVNTKTNIKKHTKLNTVSKQETFSQTCNILNVSAVEIKPKRSSECRKDLKMDSKQLEM